MGLPAAQVLGFHLCLTLPKKCSLTRIFYLENPTPPGAAQATELGSASQHTNEGGTMVCLFQEIDQQGVLLA